MAKDLTVSGVERQNILNNPYALEEIEKSVGIKGIEFRGKMVVTKEQIADFFEVTSRTIDNYLAQNEAELKNNGYEILRGKSLQALKLTLKEMDVDERYFVDIKKAPSLGIFDFRAFLNLSMLITESGKAKLLRQVILDIVIDTINKRTGVLFRRNMQVEVQSSFASFLLKKLKTDSPYFLALKHTKFPICSSGLS